MARALAVAAVAAALSQFVDAQNPACAAVGTETYDYIIIGSGAGGIPMADLLTEAGKSVLLVERGPLSSGRYNGTMKPDWLVGTNLTRFDVPGLFNQIWRDPTGVRCEDHEVMAGCVLGGGTAVNSALWWKPHTRDWDLNFPTGWKAKDMQPLIEKVWNRIPGTQYPGRDGKLLNQEGFDVVTKGLAEAGFRGVIPNDEPDAKNHTFGRPTFFLANAERHGPLRTYLETASMRSKFNLFVNTDARRLVRTGGKVTGVELECYKNGTRGAGHSGTVNVTPGTGRVILSAGTFGSAKILLRSGIGPKDQLDLVKASTLDGPTMISSDQWINLPVGYNLNDHVAPNLGPMFWQTITGSDGIVRHIQWQARVEGRTDTAMTITQYVGTGTVSRGRMGLRANNLNTRVLTDPYLRNAVDKEVVATGIEYIRGVLSKIDKLTWIVPAANVTTSTFVDSVLPTKESRGSNHWTGSATIGTDDGRTGGNAVVDLDTKVYGTDNLFVVDASIFPGQITGNPTGAIIAVAENAAKKILALK
ncbi:GMC oxidoreductase [Amniculicola lignicola CBS 123094]|uniref:GMC oxidoreductase n=1 Tax=Amniculicola lignicola CBS 123094 TaxID=1392246 RepID=A0A6A5WDJ7_9PLEO|nr:GMC oxidoreductase [Amniculicola lignicola CBS 123094]